MGGAISTVVDTITDNRQYYRCSRCGDEVWAYGSFVGTQCWECTGENPIGGVVDIACHTADTVTVGAVSTIKDTVTDNRISYDCPSCGSEVWAYGGYVRNPCWECMNNDPKKLLGTALKAAGQVTAVGGVLNGINVANPTNCTTLAATGCQFTGSVLNDTFRATAETTCLFDIYRLYNINVIDVDTEIVDVNNGTIGKTIKLFDLKPLLSTKVNERSSTTIKQELKNIISKFSDKMDTWQSTIDDQMKSCIKEQFLDIRNVLCEFTKNGGIKLSLKYSSIKELKKFNFSKDTFEQRVTFNASNVWLNGTIGINLSKNTVSIVIDDINGVFKYISGLCENEVTEQWKSEIQDKCSFRCELESCHVSLTSQGTSNVKVICKVGVRVYG